MFNYPTTDSSQKNTFWIILLLLFIPWMMTAQVAPEKVPEEQVLKAEEEQAQPKTVALFAGNVINEKNYTQGVDLPQGLVLKMDQESIKRVLKSAHKRILITLPNPDGGDDLELELTQKQIFSTDFAVFTDIEKGITIDYTPGLHYSGTVKGMKGAQVGLSIFEDEIMGIIATQTTNLVLQKLKGSKSDHFFFNEKHADGEEMLLCATPQSSEPYTFGMLNSFEKMPLGNCIRVFVEIGNSTVQDRGGMIQAINFITGVFHQSTIIFNGESINTVLSQILVRTPANDPYDGLADKGAENIRNTFQASTLAMNADLGQVVVTFGTGTGGIAANVWNALIRPAVADRLCATSKAVNQNFSVYPTYSRMVKVFNHEMGHLLNSRHTHACVWNGNSTQIDDYGNAEPPNGPVVSGAEGSACVDAGDLILDVTPTIMSYFDSFGHGQFPMSNGYGTQPGNVIRAAVAAALLSGDIETSCTAPLNDLCAGAWTLECGTTLYGNTDSATENDAPSGCSEGGLPGSGVWFTFTGNGQLFTISTADSDFDTQISIYSGSCGNLTCVGGNDDEGPESLTSLFTFCSVNGLQYYVYLDGFASVAGNYTINLSCVNDNIPPMITCPANVNVGNAPGDCGAIVTYAAATAIDNCGVQSITYSQNSNTFFPVGTTPITATALDINGNSANCVFNVTVSDEESPTINCIDGSVTFNGEEEFILNVDDYTTYDDNCGIQSVVFDIPVITCENLGDILTITATVTDIHANTANCNFNLEVLGLPCGWTFTPDGINCPGGNDVNYSAPEDEFYVESTNCYFGHPFNSDAMGFAQYELCGDGTITAHVTDISGNALGWAGVSMRESADGGSKKVQLLTNLSNLSRREVRLVTNGNSFPQQFMSFNRYWLRLTRNGNQFTGHVSPNGVHWYLAMANNVNMANCIQIGLVATNYNSNSTVTATFGNVTVDEAMPKPVSPWDEVQFAEGKNSSISVFPNPTTNGEIFIDLSGFQQEQIDILTIDPLGRVVGSKQIKAVQDDLEIMSLKDFAPGVYYLKFIGTNGLIQIQKVMYTGG